jgi:predicted enzyme related to lactoylglutathione lyase
LRRITWITADAERMANFYGHVFGMQRWYDHELAVDHRFPPTGLSDGAMARLIICRSEDPEIGMIGFLQFRGLAGGAPPVGNTLQVGACVHVFNTADLASLVERAVQAGGRIATPPTHWQVPAQDGSGMKMLLMASLFDPDGRYCEVSQAATGAPQPNR